MYLQAAGPWNVALRAMSARVLLVGVVLASLGAGCASGGEGETPDTGVHRDTGPIRDTGSLDADTGARDADTGARDANTSHDANLPDADAFVPHDTGGSICGSMHCMGFTHCVGGNCVSYPSCRGDGTCPNAGEICIALRCVPGTDDPDGDGSPASMDCDETDPTRSPLLPELCNGRDDNCNMLIDDGNAAALCMADPAHGVCMGGHCGCPAGTADIDLGVPGCECTVHPASTDGGDCASPISLGMVSDTPPGSLTAMGNALPGNRDVWYTFHATDVGDTTCDHFNVHVSFTTNPGNAYEFLVFRGSCGGAIDCPDCTACTAFTDFRFAVDAQNGRTGQCPCATSASTTVNQCSDDSADYFVRVRRKSTVAATCDQYTLSITNGMP